MAYTYHELCFTSLKNVLIGTKLISSTLFVLIFYLNEGRYLLIEKFVEE